MLGEIRFLSLIRVKELNKTWFGHFLNHQLLVNFFKVHTCIISILVQNLSTAMEYEKENSGTFTWFNQCSMIKQHSTNGEVIDSTQESFQVFSGH